MFEKYIKELQKIKNKIKIYTQHKRVQINRMELWSRDRELTYIDIETMSKSKKEIKELEEILKQLDKTSELLKSYKKAGDTKEG